MGDLTEAMLNVVQRLEGAFTLLAVHADSPGVVVGARRNSPLVVGLGDGENFLGSDVAAFIGHTRHALELGQDQIVTITPDGYAVINFDGTPSDGKAYEVTWDAAAAEKGGYATFMEKEINDQPHAVADTLLGRTDDAGRLVLDEVRISEEQLRAVERITIVACGTAAYAGMVAKYAIEHWTRIPVEVSLAHEFRYCDPIVDARTLVVSISQSGETMDTLMAVKHAAELGAMTLSICNTHGSTIPRESDAVLYTHAGPEIAVASTKAFLAQITACYVLGLYLAQLRGETYADDAKAVMAELHEIPAKIEDLLGRMDRVVEMAHFMADTRSVLFLGRNVGYPVAMEGALKLKELAYIHAEGFAAGELKHGPIALIDAGQPVFIVVPSPDTPHELHKKVVSNIQEIRARGARTIVIAHDGDDDVEAVRQRGHPHPAVRAAARAPAGRGAAAGLRAPPVHRQGPRRRPAPQPGQVGDRRVTPLERGGPVIVGVGIDVVDVARFGATLERTPALRERLFTTGERDLPLNSLAARFAAKEAVAKALGAPSGMHWHDAEVHRGTDGRPHLEVRGTVQARVEALGITSLHLSLSHDAGIASAVVVAEGPDR